MSSLDLTPGTTRRAPKGDFLTRAKSLAMKRPFIVFMALTAVLAGIYYGLIATPQYVSETRFALRSQGVAAPTGLLAGLVGGGQSANDISAVGDYIRSNDMLNVLEQRHRLRELYSQPRIDPFQTLPRDASNEQFRRFYNRHVNVGIDREAGMIIVEVKSFTPRSSQEVATSILELSESFVNALTQRMREETMRSAQAELIKAEANAQAARAAVSAFRGSRSDLDPAASGLALVESVNALEKSAADIQGQIAALSTYSRTDAPAMQQLQARLAATQRQIAIVRAQQGVGQGRPQEVTQFETLQLTRTNAEKTLATAQTAFEQARATSEQRETFVARVVNPNLPQQPTAPNRLLEFFTMLIFAMAGYALVSLTLAAIRDHRGV